MAYTGERPLGEFLRDARVAAGYGLREFAKKLAIAPSYLSDIENNRRVPSEEVLGRLAELLGLQHDELMAMAGRVGDNAERYLKQNPAAGVLFRRISDKSLAPKDLARLIDIVETMSKKRKKQP